MDLGPLELGLILLAFMALFGYKKLPDASRSLGRSLRVFKSEMRGLQADDSAPAGEQVAAVEVDQLETEAVAAEARAARLHASADASRATGAS